ncbi:hypothetical protein DCO58_01065 [Helicobacter saguini]|uniref:Uncharacterized protein n=1 Tax=Helicobacter saguini TaxID=1548018 RepID=A0A347VR62_9HELI|nr:hypothetical protein [Helicobacter saguini]MWV63021.1 hypothetical protein [Helicobacter saguini]MWV66310.1 hypothetical protein [Helicobacter saguini]MWV68662.1 hypothetical protein [Helicobacter saguini]MWV71787.1 hypothetical protein [Helicobacter saguini]TLD95815.1 hypothetical protein LS64_000120 [Helicobacter saguini]
MNKDDTILENKIKEVQELYQQLRESYSLNKAFIDTQSDESLKNIINKELESIKDKTQEVQTMIDELQEGFNFITNIQSNGKNRIEYIQDIASDNIIKDMDNKLKHFNDSYNQIFNNQNGDLSVNFMDKYNKINESYNDLYANKDNKESKIDKLAKEINDFSNKYNEIIGNEDSKYNDFNESFSEFNKKKKSWMTSM